ncbi:hypothetical protein BKA70DRAFT_1502968 [Coprinopsis sp. MPI-PUGE-AT-0042]|nr:hypothetical protein BKA70DRAFT_1502968 [Coprinopsis sp. MPI-PUGE-AT-0042]
MGLKQATIASSITTSPAEDQRLKLLALLAIPPNATPPPNLTTAIDGGVSGEMLAIDDAKRRPDRRRSSGISAAYNADVVGGGNDIESKRTSISPVLRGSFSDENGVTGSATRPHQASDFSGKSKSTNPFNYSPALLPDSLSLLIIFLWSLFMHTASSWSLLGKDFSFCVGCLGVNGDLYHPRGQQRKNGNLTPNRFLAWMKTNNRAVSTSPTALDGTRILARAGREGPALHRRPSKGSPTEIARRCRGLVEMCDRCGLCEKSEECWSSQAETAFTASLHLTAVVRRLLTSISYLARGSPPEERWMSMKGWVKGDEDSGRKSVPSENVLEANVLGEMFHAEEEKIKVISRRLESCIAFKYGVIVSGMSNEKGAYALMDNREASLRQYRGLDMDGGKEDGSVPGAVGKHLALKRRIPEAEVLFPAKRLFSAASRWG